MGVPTVPAPPHTPPFGHPELCGLCPAPSSVLCSPRAAAPAAVCPGRGAVFTLTPNNGCCLGLWLPLTGGLLPFGVRGCGAALFGYPGPLLASSSGCRLWVRCLRVESRRASVSHSRARPVALWAQLPHGGWGSYGLGSPPRCPLRARGGGSAEYGKRGTSAWSPEKGKLWGCRGMWGSGTALWGLCAARRGSSWAGGRGGGTERVNLAAATLRPGEVTSGLGAWRKASGGGL